MTHPQGSPHMKYGHELLFLAIGKTIVTHPQRPFYIKRRRELIPRKECTRLMRQGPRFACLLQGQSDSRGQPH
jgi:hypothetical protein